MCAHAARLLHPNPAVEHVITLLAIIVVIMITIFIIIHCYYHYYYYYYYYYEVRFVRPLLPVQHDCPEQWLRDRLLRLANLVEARQCLYEEFTRLAKTRLAQNSLTCINIT